MTQANATGEFIEVEGLKTFYIHRGTGMPIIVIHGGAPGACALVNWGANIEPLATLGFSVYAFDQPGYGYTDNPTDYSMEFRVTHAKAFIAALGLDRYHVMGNSQGSYIAARIALEDPKVERLVLVSSGTLAPEGSEAAKALSKAHSEALGAYVPSLENMRKLSLGTMYHPEVVTDEFVKLRYEMSIGSRLEASQSRRRAGRVKSIVDELPNMKPKTMILWGMHDGGAAPERGLLLLERMPGAELHVFSNSAHWVQRDEADRFHEIVGGFLKRE
jgi:2-hydroxy-6-oxonona-2,4-dienedioate hydrolase